MRKHTRTAQPTVTTEALAEGDAVILRGEVARVTSKKIEEDGSVTLVLDRDLDEHETMNVAFTYLGHPLWVPVPHRTCQAGKHLDYWMAWGFLAEQGGPFWCNGQHR
jgi:hypothetical protein